MAYELEMIETKITEHIFTAASDSISFDVPEFLKDLDGECAKVKKAFKIQVVSFENESLIKRYFHFHQESLIDLINTLQQNIQESGVRHVAEPVIHRLSGLLVFLEEHFPEYFDLDMKMPLVSMDSITNELRSFVALLSDKFGQCNIDMGLIQLLKNSIEQSQSNGKPMSFRTFYYFQFLRHNLENFNVDVSTETLDLIRLLINCNFNDGRFYNFMERYVNWSVSKALSVNEKLDELAFFLKFVNQQASVTGLSFDRLNPSINIQIADWISQEIQYLKLKQQLVTENVITEDVVSADFKINFDLSVSALAYLFRTFIETGVIQNKNASELIRFLTKYVKTKRSESISYESFRVKFYSVESGTKDAVKKTLQSVLDFINKN